MNSENSIIGGILFLTVAIVAGIMFLGGNSAPVPIEANKVENGQLVQESSHFIGKTDAKVTIVEFGDFQCPACLSAEPALKQVLADRKDNVRFVWRHYPLSNIHQNADNSARAAEAAGKQGKFWEMHDKLFETQKLWSTNTKSKDIFIGFAKDLGLNTDTFSKDFDSQSVTDVIKQDKGDGNALGVDATPTLFLNGEKYTGELTLPALTAKIDELEK